MFPAYSRRQIEAIVLRIPVHINALYVTLKALSDTSTGCVCPEYSLPPLEEENNPDFHSELFDFDDPGHFEEIPIEDSSDDVLDLLDCFEMPRVARNCPQAGPSTENKENLASTSNAAPAAAKRISKHKKSAKRKSLDVDKSLKSSPKKPLLQAVTTIEIEDANPELNRKLVRCLTEMFSDCDIPFIEDLCRNKEFSEQLMHDMIDQMLSNGYPPKKDETVEINFDEKLEIMISVLPDADPEFLVTELEQVDSQEQFMEIMSVLVETGDYPKLKDAEYKREVNAQIRQYTTDFDPEEFLRVIPDPVAYFDATQFKGGFIRQKVPSYNLIYWFLRNMFDTVSVKRVSSVAKSSQTVMAAIQVLTNDLNDGNNEYRLTKRRRKAPLPRIDDIPLLQLFAYIEHKDTILQVKEDLRLIAENRKKEAIANKQVNTCGCCFDDEVMPEDSYICPNGCLACVECIRRSVDILFAENKLQYPCLSACGANLSLETLQAYVAPKIFCSIVKRQQLEEVKAAGMEDLEICPFCDFAAIPAPTDKIFKCYNKECMKETCRECKEPSHIPLRCDEVERDQDVKRRVFIENKMTEALMRTCHKCNLKFIKSDGCNKMTCFCGATLCYVCGAQNIDYQHFNGQGGTAPDKCALYSNTALLHEQAAINGGMEAKKELGIVDMLVDPLADAEQRIKQAVTNYVPMPGVEH